MTAIEAWEKSKEVYEAQRDLNFERDAEALQKIVESYIEQAISKGQFFALVNVPKEICDKAIRRILSRLELDEYEAFLNARTLNIGWGQP